MRESERIVALIVRLMLLRCCRMSFAWRLTVALRPSRNRYDTCAFQMSSLVFMSALLYPRRLLMLMLVENPNPFSRFALDDRP